MMTNHLYTICWKTVFLRWYVAPFCGRKIISKSTFICSHFIRTQKKRKFYFMLNIKCLLRDFINHGIIVAFLTFIFFTESFLGIWFLESTCRIRIPTSKFGFSWKKLQLQNCLFFQLIIGHCVPPAWDSNTSTRGWSRRRWPGRWSSTTRRSSWPARGTCWAWKKEFLTIITYKDQGF